VGDDQTLEVRNQREQKEHDTYRAAAIAYGSRMIGHDTLPREHSILPDESDVLRFQKVAAFKPGFVATGFPLLD
jgi:hypothetical protein